MSADRWSGPFALMLGAAIFALVVVGALIAAVVALEVARRALGKERVR